MELNRKHFCIITTISFCFFIIIIAYKLTDASLWFDEAVEYWYSKTLTGATPGWGNGNMYERIITTYQPPLYNVLMFLWLKIHDSEWWFRFFGVLMGAIGAMGTFRSVKAVIGSECKAALSVILYALIYQQTYYWQEAAEYCLMMAVLPWCIFFFLDVLQNVNKKNITGLVIFCILAVYSQYGAVFPVFVFLLIALIHVLRNRDKIYIRYISVLYICSFILTALPLYFFFLKKQMASQGSTPVYRNINLNIGTFLHTFKKVFAFNMIPSLGDSGRILFWIISMLVALFALFYVFKGKERVLKYLIIANVLCYLLYYFMVQLTLYGHGEYGNRYNIFFIPLWFISGLYLLNEIVEVSKSVFVTKKFCEIPLIISSIIVVLLFCWGYNGWIAIQSHWEKENIRKVTDVWFNNQAYNSNTLVYYGACPGFMFYVVHNDLYTDAYLDNIVFQSFDRGQTEEFYKEYIDSVYGQGKWPAELYVVASHTCEDIDTILSVFTDNEYTLEYFYDSGEGSGESLIFLSR